MAETLTLTVDSGTYTVSVAGVALFAEEALTTPVTFPATVSADTTWYAAAATAKGRRQIGVTVNASDGTSIQVDVIQSLPATVDLGEGKVDYSGPAPTGGSVPLGRAMHNLTALAVATATWTRFSWANIDGDVLLDYTDPTKPLALVEGQFTVSVSANPDGDPVNNWTLQAQLDADAAAPGVVTGVPSEVVGDGGCATVSYYVPVGGSLLVSLKHTAGAPLDFYGSANVSFIPGAPAA